MPRLFALAVLVIVGCLAIMFSPVWAPMLQEVTSNFNALVADRPDLPSPEITGSIRPAHGRQATLMADRRGHFEVQAMINGRGVNVLVDTGATSIILRSEDALRLGLKPDPDEFTVPIVTANGTTRAAKTVLAEIRIGGVRVRNVDAMIVPAKTLATNLLGMSFIRRLSKVEMAGGRLMLVE
eukprot:gene27650-30620_t